jgi:RNA-directed DNA polymerase
MIVKLNPVIRGWANYHRHVSSKRTFSRVDHAIFRALWQRAKRRHPKKSRRWIKDRYFEAVAGRHGVFHGQVAGREEALRPVRLLTMLQDARDEAACPQSIDATSREKSRTRAATPVTLE